MDQNGSNSNFFPGWQDGQVQDLEELLKKHLSWVQRYVHNRLGDFRRSKVDTGDVVQEAMIQFLRHGPRIQLKNENQFRALLCRIIQNVVCDKYDWFTARRRAMSMERPLPPDTILKLDPPVGRQETPSKIIQKREEEAWARLGMELLEPKDREVIILHQWENLSFMEIGKLLGLSKPGARKRYVSALNKLIDTVDALQSGRLEAVLDPELSGEESDER